MSRNIDDREFEQYKRIVKFLGSAVIILIECMVYYYVWMNYYNINMKEAFWKRGNWVIVGEYLVVLLFLLKMYGGLKVGIYKYWNLVYSHMIALFGVNIFAYVQVVLFDKRIHSPAALIIMTSADYLLVLVWARMYKHIYSFFFPPKKLLLIYENTSQFHLIHRIGEREDKYEIADMMSVDEGIDQIMMRVKYFDGIIIGDISAQLRNQLVKICYEKNVRSYIVPKVSDILLRSSVELNIFDSPLYLSRNIHGLAWDQEVIKRMMDLIISGLMLFLTSPFLGIIALLIKSADHGPVIYKQIRLTKDGREFSIYKFRTMIVDAEKRSGPVKAGEKDPRILPIGHFLRATRLDELPQLINVLRGDMSLVGPRPERPELEEIIVKNIPEFQYRLKVKAGLTGYAQIFGRYCTTSYDKLKLDLTYIRKYSIWLDLKLILMTPKVLFMKESTDGFENGLWEDPALIDPEEKE